MSKSIENPLVSVVMPVFNARAYLREALDSILEQSFSDFEFVIIDDGSTDASGELLREYAKRDQRILLIQRENLGIGPSRNEGWKLATGDLVAIMDADDIAVSDRLEKQVAFLKRNPEVICVGGYTRLIDNKGRWIPCPLYPPIRHDELVSLLLKGACPISNSAVMMRREAIAKVGGYDEDLSMAEDYALWLKLSEVGELANIPEVLVSYRIHEESVSAQKSELQMARAKLAWERAVARRGVFATFEQTSDWRAKPTRESKHSFALTYGWWAFNGGERRTAFVYGIKAIRLMPWRSEGWRLAACAFLKQTGENAKTIKPSAP